MSVGQGGRLAAALLAGASLAACATTTPAPQPGYKVGRPYEVGGVRYTPREQPNYDETGLASWYGEAFQNKSTANGEIFDMNGLSAAHPTLPMPSIVEVTNLANGRKVQVRVNDRGPFVGDRLIDVSREAARELDFDRAGTTKVRVRYIGPAPLTPSNPRRYVYNRVPMGVMLLKAQYDQPIVTAPRQPAPVAAMDVEKVTPDDIPVYPAIRGALPPEPAPTIPRIRAAPAEPSTPRGASFEIQVAAFADPANAQRTVTSLAGMAQAAIVPLQRNGTTLYRVVVRAAGDQATAFALRDRIAVLGFKDARIISGF